MMHVGCIQDYDWMGPIVEVYVCVCVCAYVGLYECVMCELMCVYRILPRAVFPRTTYEAFILINEVPK